MSDAYVSVDFDWNILHLNSKTADWSALARDEITGRSMWEAFPALLETPLHDFYQRCMKARRAEAVEHFSQMTNRWYQARAKPTSRGLNIFVSDITDNKRIAEGQDQFLTMVNAIPQLGWMADHAGYIHWYNDRWYEYTGTSLEETVGWGWEKVHHPEHIDRVVAFVTEAWKQDKPWELTFPLRGKDGNYRWFLTKVYPIRDTAGKVQQWIGTNTDIHDQKVANETLEQKVAERTSELEAANEHLMNVNEELRQFNYAASHDLQEPLRKIKIFSERIKTQDFEKLSTVSKGSLDRVMVSVDRMSNLLKDLLDFSSTSREKHFEQVNLNEIIADVKSDLELLITQKGASVIKSDLPTINAIPLQMHQLFYNLINNAVKFATPDREPIIHISGIALSGKENKKWQLPAKQQYFHLSVQDNGIGFEPQYAEKIFELFKRLHSQESYRGTGIGLALCKKVVDNHEGRIWAESEYGKGAAFHVILPVK